MNKKQLLSVRVDEEYAKDVWDFAYEHKMNLSELIRAALKEYMEKN